MKKIVFFALLTLTWISCSQQPQTTVYGRYVPERKDDFAWENDFAAYRFYGPALAPENPSNGVDIFMKNTPALVLDTFFYNYVNYRIPYHVQHGIGFDGYKVAHTTGCGGPAVVVNDSLYIGDQYDTWEIIEQTPTRLVFHLHYDSMLIAGFPFSEDITITCCAGQVLNRADVVFTPYDQLPDQPILVGAGLYLHDSIGELHYLNDIDAIVYTETALNDPGAVRLNRKWYDNIDLGQTHEAVIMPNATNLCTIANTALALMPYTPGTTLTYWFGGCWSRWTNDTDTQPAFASPDDWQQAVRVLTTKLK